VSVEEVSDGRDVPLVLLDEGEVAAVRKDNGLGARRALGSNASSTSIAPSRKCRAGTPLETIVWAAAPGESTACCSATNEPIEWPSTA
jgi:hypothetical protein